MRHYRKSSHTVASASSAASPSPTRRTSARYTRQMLGWARPAATLASCSKRSPSRPRGKSTRSVTDGRPKPPTTTTDGGGATCALPASIYEKRYDVLHEFSAAVLTSTTAGDRFGGAVSIAKNEFGEYVLAVGAYSEDFSGNNNNGAVYTLLSPRRLPAEESARRAQKEAEEYERELRERRSQNEVDQTQGSESTAGAGADSSECDGHTGPENLDPVSAKKRELEAELPALDHTVWDSEIVRLENTVFQQNLLETVESLLQVARNHGSPSEATKRVLSPPVAGSRLEKAMKQSL